MPIQGTQIDQGEVDAVFIALKAEADRDVPAWERGMISDDVLRKVAAAAVVASVKYRNAPSI